MSAGEKEKDMNINFYPERAQMAKEVDRCVSQGRIETLHSFCNSCMIKSLPMILAPDCLSCKVGHALAEITRSGDIVDGNSRFVKTC